MSVMNIVIYKCKQCGKTFIAVLSTQMVICNVHTPYELKVCLHTFNFLVHFKYIHQLTVQKIPMNQKKEERFLLVLVHFKYMEDIYAVEKCYEYK
jgi:hypothetical protein